MPYKDPAKRAAWERANYLRNAETINARKRAWIRDNPEQHAKQAKRQHDYAQQNREALNAKRRARHAANPAKRRARDAQPENRAKQEERNRAQYAKNQEAMQARSRAYAAAHREKRRTYLQTYKQENPDRIRQVNKAYAARKLATVPCDLTAAQWQTIQAAFDHRCAYCGKRCKGHLTQDHLTPLSKGGSHTLSNVVPACSPCNSRKHAGPVLAPVQPLLL